LVDDDDDRTRPNCGERPELRFEVARGVVADELDEHALAAAAHREVRKEQLSTVEPDGGSLPFERPSAAEPPEVPSKGALDGAVTIGWKRERRREWIGSGCHEAHAAVPEHRPRLELPTRGREHAGQKGGKRASVLRRVPEDRERT